jgi:hypothetical protein
MVSAAGREALNPLSCHFVELFFDFQPFFLLLVTFLPSSSSHTRQPKRDKEVVVLGMPTNQVREKQWSQEWQKMVEKITPDHLVKI